jgi:disulfide bond formation protein DsbB
MSTTVRPDRSSAAAESAQIDPRGARVAATLTTLVLALALLLSPSPVTVVLLGVQAVVFAIGATRGVQHTPYAWLFKRLLRPRLGPPAELEDAAPPRFAQTVGLVFAVVALAGYLLGADLVGAIATGFALAAAFLNAAFGFCLGCELYLLGKRLTTS